MIVIQDFFGFFYVQVILGAVVPGQRCDPVQVGRCHRIFGRRRMHAGQPFQLPFGFLAGFLRQVLCLNFCPVFIDLNTCFIFFTQLFFDGFELLPQIILSLNFIHIPLDLVLDFTSQFQDVELMICQAGDDLQPFFDVHRFQDFLLFFRARVNGGCNHVGHRAGFLDGLGHLGQLGGQSRRKLYDPFKLIDEVRHQRLRFVVLFLDILDQFNTGTEVGFTFFKT